MTLAWPADRQQRQEQAALVMRLLRRQYPGAVCTLVHQNPFHLLVAAILSAQCTDARVNQVTPALFARYPDAAAMAAAGQEELETLIRSCGLFRTKARNIRAASQVLLTRHGGRLPRDPAALQALPGVGRKIANLLLGDAFAVPAIVVDTHCARISRLIGFTEEKDPLRVEKDLAAILEPADWIDYGHLMVEHGRTCCVANRPDCPACPLAASACRYAASLAAAGSQAGDRRP